MSDGTRAAEEERSPQYLRKLLALLSAATFFEGYDSFVLALVLPSILVSFHASKSAGGLAGAIVQVGAIGAFLLAAQADRFGRRRLLLVTILGYTAATALTAVSSNIAELIGAQFLGRVFLGAEFATAITIIVEEFPAHRRGRSLGILTSMGTLGGVFVGVLGFIGLGNTPLDWRAFYLVGILPLIVFALARRNLDESLRYTRMRSEAADSTLNHTSIWEPWKPRYRGTVLAVGSVGFFRNLVAAAAIFWWATYAQDEAGLSLKTTSLYIGVAGIVGVIGYIVAGRLMDRFGRRRTLIGYMGPALIFGVLAFNLHSGVPLLVSLCGGIFFGLGSGAVTTAFATEPFPTYVRGRAATWCRNAFEVPAAVLAPVLIGFLGDPSRHLVGSIGNAMTLLFPICVIPVIFITARYLPETKDVNFVEMDARASEIGSIRNGDSQVS